MKEVTLKVNGSLYVMKSYSKNFAGQIIETRASTAGMPSFSNKIELDELILDRDMELSGEVYVQDLIIPDGVKFRILCANSLTFLVTNYVKKSHIKDLYSLNGTSVEGEFYLDNRL